MRRGERDMGKGGRGLVGEVDMMGWRGWRREAWLLLG
jgi:hypothetical protein